MTQPRTAVNHDLAWKAGLCIFIGLLVLAGPMFMGASWLRDTVAQSALVGWFSLVLGLAFGAQYWWNRRKASRGSI